jgi:hypothetical protein
MDELDEHSSRDGGFPSRQTVLVMSDGHDEGSGNTLDQLSSRLLRSRVRLDAVGLARSSTWLKNLQVMAHTGFGEFGSTATPEGLTGLLQQGIERVMEAPVIEFQADTFEADGRLHRVVIEHVPTRWQDETEVLFPARPMYARRATWLAAVLVLLAVGGMGIGAVARSRGRRATASKSSDFGQVPHLERQSPSPETPRERPGRSATEVEPPTETRSRVDTSRHDGAEPSAPPPVLRPETTLAPTPAERSRALIALAGPYTGQRFQLNDGEFWIGSSNNNHLCLNADPSVSGNHACIRTQEQFRRIYDNGSLNGTYVNERRIGDEPVLIRTGDRIRIGQTNFTVAP